MEKYQDYAIKDGKFIGRFEEMYQKFANPWHQEEVIEHSYSRLNTVLTLQNMNAKYVLEIGCGLGAFTNYLSQALPDILITGMDISETAVAKASTSYPQLSFFVGDVKDIDKIICQSEHKFDAIIFSEIMWFILPDLEQIINKLKENFKGCLIINQTFYKSGQQYGTEFFTNPDEMASYLKLKRLGYSMADMQDWGNSYETHTLFQL